MWEKEKAARVSNGQLFGMVEQRELSWKEGVGRANASLGNRLMYAPNNLVSGTVVTLSPLMSDFSRRALESAIL